MAAQKAKDNGECLVPKGVVRKRTPFWGPRSQTFGEVNLSELGVPKGAWPLKNHTYKGKKGYTLYSPNGAVTCFPSDNLSQLVSF